MASHTYTPQAHSRAITKYTKDKLDRIEIRIPKETGFKAQVTEYARSKGLSVNAFIIEAVKKAMKDNLNGKKQELIKTFSYEIGEEYKPKTIGEGYSGTNLILQIDIHTGFIHTFVNIAAFIGFKHSVPLGGKV